MRWVAQASVSGGEQSFFGYRCMVGCGQPFPASIFLFFLTVHFSQTIFCCFSGKRACAKAPHAIFARPLPLASDPIAPSGPMPFNASRAREDDEKRLALRALSLANYPLSALQKLAALPPLAKSGRWRQLGYRSNGRASLPGFLNGTIDLLVDVPCPAIIGLFPKVGR
jgi:hypothetical protein